MIAQPPGGPVPALAGIMPALWPRHLTGCAARAGTANTRPVIAYRLTAGPGTKTGAGGAAIASFLVIVTDAAETGIMAALGKSNHFTGSAAVWRLAVARAGVGCARIGGGDYPVSFPGLID